MEEILKDDLKRKLFMEIQNPNSATLGDECEYITLPSKGYFYRGQFRNLDKIKVRRLNWTDEDILTTESYYDNGTVFDELLDRVIVDDTGITGGALLPVDRDAILMWLRIDSFGKEYEIKRKCPKCKSLNKYTWNLGDFDMPEYNPDFINEIREHGEVEIILPISKKKVKICIPNRGKELDVRKKLVVKKEKSDNDQDYLITGKLLSSICAVYSEDDKKWLRDAQSISNFLSNELKALQDSRAIIQKCKDIDLKINTKKDVSCSNKKCDHHEEGVEMPMSIYFFWPEYKGV